MACSSSVESGDASVDSGDASTDSGDAADVCAPPPQTTADYCGGRCTSGTCYAQTNGTTEGGLLSSSCTPPNGSCVTCANLVCPCPTCACGINHGVLEIACINN